MAGSFFGVMTLGVAALLWVVAASASSIEPSLAPGETAFVLILAAVSTASGVLLIRYGMRARAQEHADRRGRPGNSN